MIVNAHQLSRVRHYLFVALVNQQIAVNGQPHTSSLGSNANDLRLSHPRPHSRATANHNRRYIKGPIEGQPTAVHNILTIGSPNNQTRGVSSPDALTNRQLAVDPPLSKTRNRQIEGRSPHGGNSGRASVHQHTDNNAHRAKQHRRALQRPRRQADVPRTGSATSQSSPHQSPLPMLQI